MTTTDDAWEPPVQPAWSESLGTDGPPPMRASQFDTGSPGSATEEAGSWEEDPAWTKDAPADSAADVTGPGGVVLRAVPAAGLWSFECCMPTAGRVQISVQPVGQSLGGDVDAAMASRREVAEQVARVVVEHLGSGAASRPDETGWAQRCEDLAAQLADVTAERDQAAAALAQAQSGAAEPADAAARCAALEQELVAVRAERDALAGAPRSSTPASAGDPTAAAAYLAQGAEDPLPAGKVHALHPDRPELMGHAERRYWIKQLTEMTLAISGQLQPPSPGAPMRLQRVRKQRDDAISAMAYDEQRRLRIDAAWYADVIDALSQSLDWGRDAHVAVALLLAARRFIEGPEAS